LSAGPPFPTRRSSDLLGAARIVPGPVRNRFDLTPVRVAEEESDRDLVVSLVPLDPGLVKAPLQVGALVVRDADSGMSARPARLRSEEHTSELQSPDHL